MTHQAKHAPRGRIGLVALALSVFAGAFGAAIALAAAAPALSGTTVSAITDSSATLKAAVNPNSRETSYHFEYVDQASFESGEFSAAQKTPQGIVPGGKDDVPVSAQIGGLTQSTTYHYRIVASNVLGETNGPGLSFTTYASPPSFNPCPNDAFRMGHPSADLPDCRAYEQATPVKKNGGDASGQIFKVQASLAGDAVTSQTQAGLPGGEGAQDFPIFLSHRGMDSWSTEGVLPPPSYGEIADVAAWTPDLAYVFDRATLAGSDLVGKLDTAFLSRSSSDGSIEEIVPHTDAASYSFVAASTDDSKVFFEARGEGVDLTGDAAAGKNNLYLWDRDTGDLSLVGVLPASACAPPCAPPGGSFAGPYDWWNGETETTVGRGGAAANYFTQELRAISASGDRAYFTAGGGQLYLRDGLNGPSPETVHVSASRKTNGPTGPDPAGTRPAAFMAASRDGSVAFLASPEKLTNDANTGPEPPLPAIGRAGIQGGPASVEPDFLPATAAGVAEDGTYVYWANPGKGTIGRAKLDGSGAPDEQFITGAGTPQYVAVDATYLYWTNAGDGEDGHGTIGRAKLDGSELPKLDFITTGVSNPQGIAVNATHIYWANAGAIAASGEKSIASAAIDGTDVKPKFADPLLLPNPNDFPAGVAVDANHLYWTFSFRSSFTTFNGFIVRTDLDGSNKKFIYLGDNVKPLGVAVDSSHVYWAAQGENAIGRINLDLEEASLEKEFIAVDGRLKGLATDASHVYWSANGEFPGNPGNDLYRYDVDNDQLTDITADPAGNGAEVQGVLGASDDGSYLYFVANGDLDGAEGPATPGNCANVDAGFRGSGICNLYLWHDGVTSFVARLDVSGGPQQSDATNLLANPDIGAGSSEVRTARVSADGETLLFRSQRQLAAYENAGIPELYRFHLGDPAPLCVSCNPTGALPGERPKLHSIKAFGVTSGAKAIFNRVLSAGGDRVFFETADQLVAADVNGNKGCPEIDTGIRSCQDVYEWEAEGSGSCRTAGGCLYLLSTGTSSSPSYFGDASASGDDVFIFTRDRLMPQDQDDLQDLYDVKTDGGLVSQNQPPPPPPCEGEACRGSASATPQAPSAGTAAFKGPGNAKQRKPKPRCAKGERQVRRNGKARCVKRNKRTHANRRTHR